MKSLATIFTFHRPQELDITARSLAKLRLIVLACTLSVLCFWHFTYSSLDDIYIAIAVLCTSIGWSLAVLKRFELTNHRFAVVQELLVDYLWIGIVVYICGRAANPFIYYYLVTGALAASLVNKKIAWGLCALGIFIYSVMLLVDVQAHFEHFSNSYKIHLVGMWFNFVASSAVICFFVTRLMTHIRSQHAAITHSRETNLKNEQLIALATVSASTVHDLATPLSTLNVLCDELKDNEMVRKFCLDDLDLMQKQIERCRNTIAKLSLLAQKSDEKNTVSVASMIEDLENHFSLHHPMTIPVFESNISHKDMIVCSAMFEYALINLINNALQASSTLPVVVTSTTHNVMTMTISNDSNQASSDILKKWGRASTSQKSTGVGIGSLLANSTIEKEGGEVNIDVTKQPDSNRITVSVQFPLSNKHPS